MTTILISIFILYPTKSHFQYGGFHAIRAGFGFNYRRLPPLRVNQHWIMWGTDCCCCTDFCKLQLKRMLHICWHPNQYTINIQYAWKFQPIKICTAALFSQKRHTLYHYKVQLLSIIRNIEYHQAYSLKGAGTSVPVPGSILINKFALPANGNSDALCLELEMSFNSVSSPWLIHVYTTRDTNCSITLLKNIDSVSGTLLLSDAVYVVGLFLLLLKLPVICWYHIHMIMISP